jgi:uncharacterized protein YdaU (DUF1376 family)
MDAMSAAPFMQLYVADYIGDTLHLTTEQHGAYLLLLMAMWRAGGSLPNDEQKLARIVGLSPARWRRVNDDVLAFFDVSEGEISQKRLTAEIEKAKEKSAKRAEAGAKGGAAKSLKNNKPAVAIANVLPKHSSEPEPEPEREDKKKDAAKAALVRTEAEFAAWYEGYPLKAARPAALKAFAKARTKADLPTLIEGVRRYRQNKPPDQAWAHPASWLNAERWTDEPSTDHHHRRNSPGHHHREPRGFDAVMSAVAGIAHRRGLTEPGGDAGMDEAAGDPDVVDAEFWPARRD